MVMVHSEMGLRAASRGGGSGADSAGSAGAIVVSSGTFVIVPDRFSPAPPYRKSDSVVCPSQEFRRVQDIIAASWLRARPGFQALRPLTVPPGPFRPRGVETAQSPEQPLTHEY